MPTTIPQPYGPSSINTDAIGDEVAAAPPVRSTASPSSSLHLFSSSSSASHIPSGRMTSISPMPQGATVLHHHHHHHHPPTTIGNTGGPEGTSTSYYQPATRPQGPAGALFALDAVEAGVDHHPYHGRLGHHHSLPQPVPAPPALLPSQHDILHTTLNDAVNTPTNNTAKMVHGPRSSMSAATDHLGPQTPTSPRPKRRGRRPKSYYLSSDPSTTPANATADELDADGNPRNPRRNRVLERNRIAATKCRVRKRDEAEALASREKDMEDQNRHLASCLDSLTAEVYHLKNELLRHADCDFELIQKYIAHQARQSVDKMLLPPLSSSTFPPPSSSHRHHHHHIPLATGSLPAPVPVAPIGGESVSPYQYGTRLGSSAGSSADSVSLRGAEEDGVGAGHGQILWANPFSQPVAASPTSSVPIPPPLSLPQRPMESSPTSLMTPVNMLPRTSADVTEYGDNLCISNGPQSQRVNDVGWDYQWNYH